MSTWKPSKAQLDALVFALTEGEVGPGAKWGNRARVKTATIHILVARGLLVLKPNPPADSIFAGLDDWGVLTEAGKAIAAEEHAVRWVL